MLPEDCCNFVAPLSTTVVHGRFAATFGHETRVLKQV